jgi:nitroreductase
MVLEVIRRRRSVRQYTTQQLDDSQIHLLLEAAMCAPSANDSRPWHFIVVRDAALRAQLSQAHQWAGMAAQAPVVFVICGDEQRSDHWVEDTSAATENLLLQATSMGLGGVWIGIYPRSPREDYVRSVMGLPIHLRVLCLVPLGYPSALPNSRSRFDPTRVHHDRFDPTVSPDL